METPLLFDKKAKKGQKAPFLLLNAEKRQERKPSLAALAGMPMPWRTLPLLFPFLRIRRRRAWVRRGVVGSSVMALPDIDALGNRACEEGEIAVGHVRALRVSVNVFRILNGDIDGECAIWHGDQ